MSWLQRAIEAIDDYRTAVGCAPKRILTTPSIVRVVAAEMVEGARFPYPYHGQPLFIDGVPVVGNNRVPPDTMYCDGKEPYE